MGEWVMDLVCLIVSIVVEENLTRWWGRDYV